MPKFRKKPVVIEAFQMTAIHRWDSFGWPSWLHEAWKKEDYTEGALYCDTMNTHLVFITTLEGRMLVSSDDWIIKGIQGELYPCKPDIFEATYDRVPDDED